MTTDLTLDFQFDKLEIYGTNVFQVNGGYPSLMINQTKEYCGRDNQDLKLNRDSDDGNIITMNSYLLQVELVNNNNNISKWKSLTIQIEDYNNNFAWTKVFNKNII